jgi:hypothetical protein
MGLHTPPKPSSSLCLLSTEFLGKRTSVEWSSHLRQGKAQVLRPLLQQ